MLHLLSKPSVGGNPGPEAYQRKWYAQRRRLRRKFTSKNEASPTWAPLPNPKIKLHYFLQSSSFTTHSSKCSFKSAFFQTSIFKFYLLSSISALFLSNCSIPSYQKFVERFKTKQKNFNRFLKKVLCFVKWPKANIFFDQIFRIKADKTAKSFPTYRILAFKVW